MGYASETQTAYQHLREKVAAALMGQVSPLVGQANPNSALAEAIVVAPNRGIEQLLVKIQAVDGITVESTDAQLDTAVLATSSIALMKTIYGIS